MKRNPSLPAKRPAPARKSPRVPSKPRPSVGGKSRTLMLNLVGDELPSLTQCARWQAYVTKVIAQVAPFTIQLNPEARSHGVRMPPQSDRVLAIVGAQAQRMGIAIPNATVDHMNNDYTLAGRIQPILDAVWKVASRLDDTMVQAESECWWAATAYYTMLDRMSGADADLDKEIEEVREFFRLGPRAVDEPAAADTGAAKAAGTTTAAPATTAATPTATDASAAKKPSRKRTRTLMQNLVGDTLPTAAEQKSCIEMIETLGTQIAPSTTSLTTSQRKHSVRMRPGARRVLDVVGALATRFNLSIPNATVAHMNADYALAERLQPVYDVVSQLASRLDDTILQAHSECWWAATAYYTMLDRIAGADVDLDKALPEVRAFFKKGPRKNVVKGTGPTRK